MHPSIGHLGIFVAGKVASYKQVRRVTFMDAIPPSSNHPGGVNVCFADGSVHFLSYNLGTTLWLALATKSNGEVIPGNSF